MRANDGFEKRNKIKNNFCSQVLEFYFLVFELKSTCVEEQMEGIMNGDNIMGNENV